VSGDPGDKGPERPTPPGPSAGGDGPSARSPDALPSGPERPDEKPPDKASEPEPPPGAREVPEAPERLRQTRREELTRELWERFSEYRPRRDGPVFNGPVHVHRDFNVGGHGPRDREQALRRIEAAEIAGHVDHFVPPPSFERALAVLRRDHVVVLACRPGTGRYAAALNLLARVTARSAERALYEVQQFRPVIAATWEPPEAGGYVLVLPGADLGIDAADDDRRDPDEWIRVAKARLAAHGSYLVVIADPAIVLHLEATVEAWSVIEDLGDVDPVAIVRRRVLGAAPAADDVSALQRSLVRTGALELLTARPAPRIAALLSYVAHDDQLLAAATEPLIRADGQVRAWFARNRDIESRAYTLAVAVLEEAGYLTVADAAVLLCKELGGQSSDLQLRDRLRSDDSWIVLYAEGHGTDPGELAPRRIRFRNPRVKGAVLAYAWTHFDHERPAIHRWLGTLAEHHDPDVRTMASFAAGAMAWNDPVHAVHSHLTGWAASQSPLLREAAATALGIIGGNPELAPSVWSLLWDWSTREGNLPLTAATTVGDILGWHEPVLATELLGPILERDRIATFLAVSRSLVRLIDNGRVGEVLDALVTWTAPEDRSPMVTNALYAFLYATRQPRASAEPATVTDRSHPGLLTTVHDVPPLLVVDASEHRETLARLWGRALARRPVQDFALEVLHECVTRYAEDDMEVFVELRELVRCIAGLGGRHRERLQWHLGQWAEDRQEPSDAAGRILDTLGPVDRRRETA
jgi:hypothetical protein